LKGLSTERSAPGTFCPWWAILPRALEQTFAQRAQLGAAAPRAQIGFGSEEQESYQLRDGVAVIQLVGVLTKGGGWWADSSMMDVQAQVERAAADPAVNAILLRIDSPGGTVAGVSDLAEAVYAARQKKPVTAYISDLGASAAFYVASQAGRIYGDTDAMVGSIGVYCVVPDFSEMAAKEGIKIHVVKAGAMKGAGQPGTAITEEQLADFQREIDQLNETFVDAVARGRGWPRQKVQALNDGRVHVGTYAVANGLLDGVMSFEQALEGLKTQTVVKARAARRLAAVAARGSERGINHACHVAGGIHRGTAMSQKLRAYLESIGLKASATEAQAWAFMATLEGDQAAEARRLYAEDGGEDETEEEDEASAEDAGDEKAEDGEEDDPPEDGEEDDEDEEQARRRTADAAAAEVRRAAAAAERSRVSSLITLGNQFNMTAAWVQKQIRAGTTVRAAKDAILAKLSATQAPLRIAVGEDLNRSTIGQAVVDALLLKAGLRLAGNNADGELGDRKPHPRALGFRGISARQLCREFLSAQGVPVAGVSDAAVVKLVFDRQPMGVHTTSDFDNVLANALNKSLQREYQLKPVAWPKWCSRNTAPDFRQVERPRLAEAPALAAIKEGGEYTLATIGDSKEVYTLVKYGKAFELTWEALLNDDLGAFGRLSTRFINAARRLEDVTAFGVLTANANMGDGNALFDATNHGNLAAGSDIDPPSVATLNVMRKAMRVQTSGASILNIEPRFIIAPAALEGTVLQLLASMSNPASSNAGVANIWQNGLEPIIDGTLDSDSAIAWYAAADPALTETVEVCFLQGYESPTLEVTDKMNPDKRTFTVRHVIAAKALDWKGLYKNAGTA